MTAGAAMRVVNQVLGPALKDLTDSPVADLLASMIEEERCDSAAAVHALLGEIIQSYELPGFSTDAQVKAACTKIFALCCDAGIYFAGDPAAASKSASAPAPKAAAAASASTFASSASKPKAESKATKAATASDEDLDLEGFEGDEGDLDDLDDPDEPPPPKSRAAGAGAGAGAAGERKAAAPAPKRAERKTEKERREDQRRLRAQDRAQDIKSRAARDDLDDSISEQLASQTNKWHQPQSDQSKDIQMLDVVVSVEGHDLLEASPLRFLVGRRYGMVGKNGCGKTTLLRRMARRRIEGFPEHVRCLYVRQEVPGTDKSVIENVLAADVERTELLREEAELLEQLEKVEDAKVAGSGAGARAAAARRPADTTASSSSTTATTTAGAAGAASSTEEKKGGAGAGAAAAPKAAAKSASAKTESKAPAKAAAKAPAKAVVVDTKSGDRLTDRLNEVYARLDAIDAHSANARASEILIGLGFTQDGLKTQTSRLSGGWRMRVALACALFMQPDVLMLDEPTNHLDLEAVLWLQGYLKQVDSTVIVVSHDRGFLDAVCTDIVHFHQKKLTYYPGNYTVFETAREDKKAQMSRLQENLDRQRDHIHDSIAKMTARAKGTKKGADDKRLNQVASRRMKLDRMGLEKMPDGKRFHMQTHTHRIGSAHQNAGGWQDRKRTAGRVDETPDKEIKFDFASAAAEPLGTMGPVVQFKKASFTYKEAKAPTLRDIVLDIDMKSRVTVLGKNGAGKSTFLNLLMGTLEPTSASTVFRHNSLRLAFFTQHHVDSLDLSLTPLEHLSAEFKDKKEHDIRAQLGRFGITGRLAGQPIATLSGGQKSRVVFAIVTFQKPHILLLDEPTNHLDFASIDALTKAINEFPGGVVLVSHDQKLITDCSKQFLEVADGRVKRLEGGFAEYKRRAMEAVDQKS